AQHYARGASRYLRGRCAEHHGGQAAIRWPPAGGAIVIIDRRVWADIVEEHPEFRRIARKGEIGQAGAEVKRVLRDSHDTGREKQIGYIGAIAKRETPKLGDAIRDDVIAGAPGGKLNQFRLRLVE